MPILGSTVEMLFNGCYAVNDSVLSVCKITGQELDEDLVVVPQLCLESSYCP